MRYAAGIDSGGSHYRIKLADETGEIIAYKEFSPIIHSAYSDASNKLDEIQNAILSVLPASSSVSDIKSMVCGIAGLDSDEDKSRIDKLYALLLPHDCSLKIVNDIELAFSASVGETGIVVASGTGSMAMGRLSDGHMVRVGGWPIAIYGDEGSGSWIARHALRELGRFFDGFCDDTILIGYLIENLDIRSRKALLDFARLKCSDPISISSICPFVDKAAEEGDTLAISLLDSAAYELSRLAFGLDDILGLSKIMPSFTVGIWGSVLRKSRILQERFSMHIKERFPEAIIKRPIMEAVDCALAQALENLNN